MKIGLVGAAATIETIHALMDGEEVFVELVDYPCHRENVVELLAEIQSGLDGVLFTGEAIFVHAGRYASAIVPWTYLKRSVNSVLCVLLRAAMDGHDIRRITYDLPYFTSKEMLGLLCDRVGLDKSEVMVNCYSEYKDSAPDAGRSVMHPQTPQHWHLENFRAGRASVCLSSVDSTVSHPLLKDYPGVIMGVSAGSMNAADIVYAQPEEPGEAVDPDYRRFIPGLGLTDKNILPHYNMVRDNILDGRRLFEDISYADSHGHTFYVLPDGSYILEAEGTSTLYGEAWKLQDGVMEKICADGESVILTSQE